MGSREEMTSDVEQPDLSSEPRGKRLYAMHTMAGKEQEIIFQCRKNILRESEDIFCPVIERLKKFHGVETRVWSDMYPGYLFVETDVPQDFFLRIRFGLGKCVFGYLQVLRNDDYILPLAPDEERMLRELMDDKHRVLMSYGYRMGDQVVVTSGPLRNFTGKVVDYNGHRKFAVIETKILGDLRKVVVGADIVRKAADDGRKKGNRWQEE